MSSISQMERSSSQTRILATHPPGRGSQRLGHFQRVTLGRRDLLGRYCAFGVETAQSQHKRAALSGLRSGKDLSVMSLHDLVNNREPESGAAFKVRLEGLENLFHLLRRHAGACVGERDLPVVAERFQPNRELATVLHGADRVFAEIPEDL